MSSKHCGFCARPYFATQELLEQHIDSCAPIHGFVARYGTGSNSVGRRFICDPVSGLASLRPQHAHICPWCMATFQLPEQAREHRLSCKTRKRTQAQYQASENYLNAASSSNAAQQTTRNGGVRELLPNQSTQSFQHIDPRLLEQRLQPQNRVFTPQFQNLQQHRGPVLASQPVQAIRSPYFASNSDERTLLNRINEPPSHSVTSLLVDIARSTADARAIPEAPVHPRLLPIAKPYPKYQPAQLPAIQSKPALTASKELLQAMAQSKTMIPGTAKAEKTESATRPTAKAKKSKRIRFTICEGCDKYCKHSRKIDLLCLLRLVANITSFRRHR